jgi:hypothetical protein
MEFQPRRVEFEFSPAGDPVHWQRFFLDYQSNLQHSTRGLVADAGNDFGKINLALCGLGGLVG